MAKGPKITRKNRIIHRLTAKRIGKLTRKTIKLVGKYDPLGDPVENLKILARAAEDIDVYLGETNPTALANFQSYLQTVVSRVHAEIEQALDQIKLAKQTAHGAEAANANDELSRMFRMLGI